MILGPVPVLAALVGLFHVSAYVFIRGRAGARLPLLVIAAVLGAWAGDAVGGRLGDPVTIGDFHVLAASFVAWLGIGLVAILAVLAPERAKERPARPSFGRRVLAGLGRSELPGGSVHSKVGLAETEAAAEPVAAPAPVGDPAPEAAPAPEKTPALEPRAGVGRPT